MSLPPPRTVAERVRDVRRRLDEDVDLWVATASADGDPYLVPLSFHWHDGQILLASTATSVTVRNLRRTDGRVRLALGETRDVVLIDGDVTFVGVGEVEPAVAEAYAARAGWDPRDNPANVFVVVTPTRIRAWREVNELEGRTVMRDGAWLA